MNPSQAFLLIVTAGAFIAVLLHCISALIGKSPRQHGRMF